MDRNLAKVKSTHTSHQLSMNFVCKRIGPQAHLSPGVTALSGFKIINHYVLCEL